MVKKTFAAILLAILLSFGNSVLATDFSSTDFVVKDPVIVPGAGFSVSNDFQLWSSIGQAAIGQSSTSSFGLEAGFLYFPAPIVITPTTVPSVPAVLAPAPGGGALLFPVPKIKVSPALCDFNNDNRCDIIDFSILLYYFNKPATGIERYDLNNDRKIDIIDISILLYYWTD